MQSSGEKKKLSHDDSLTIFNFKKKLDSVLHNCRKTAYRKLNEQRRSKTFAKSLDKPHDPSSNSQNSDLQSKAFIFRKNSLFSREKHSFHLENLNKNSMDVEKSHFSNKKSQNSREIKEKQSISLEIDELIEKDSEKILENLKFDGEEEDNLTKLKEIVYKLQLRDAVHRQKIMKLQNSNSDLQRNFEIVQSENSKLLELRKQVTIFPCFF